jgi:hypothetical protein
VPKLIPQSDKAANAAKAEREWWEAGFQRSKRDNLWRHYQGMVLTVFAIPQGDDDDLYGWLIANEVTGEKTYSSQKFEGEAEALADLWYRLKERECS